MKRTRSEIIEESNAIFTAGQLMGLATRLNYDALERFLSKPNPDFRYTREAQAALLFAKAVQNL